MLFPNAIPALDDFSRADGAIGANWITSDFTANIAIVGGRGATGQAFGVDAGSAWKVPFTPLEVIYAQVAVMPPTTSVTTLMASQDPFQNFAYTQVDLIFSAGSWTMRIETGDDTVQANTAFVNGDWMALTINQVTGLNTAWRLPVAGGGWQSVATANMPSLTNGTRGWYAILVGRDDTVRWSRFGAQTLPGTDPTLNARNELGRGAC